MRRNRAAELFPDDPAAAASTCAAATDVMDSFRISHVPIVQDDDIDVCTAALRDVLADILRHHISPAPKAAVFSGPFGSGKRILMQRILSLYSDRFCMPPVYTTNAASAGGTFTLVEEGFIDGLEQDGLLAFKQTALGKLYAVSKGDVCR